jgi:hypothetical protein
VLGVHCHEDELWDHCSLKPQLLQKIIKIFDTMNSFLEENQWDCWFQQDAANAHTAKIPTAFLQDFFGDHIIRRDFSHHNPQTLRHPNSAEDS